MEQLEVTQNNCVTETISSIHQGAESVKYPLVLTVVPSKVRLNNTLALLFIENNARLFVLSLRNANWIFSQPLPNVIHR